VDVRGMPLVRAWSFDDACANSSSDGASGKPARSRLDNWRVNNVTSAARTLG
jgi:hypothetical protein